MNAAHRAGGIPEALGGLAIPGHLNIGSGEGVDHQRADAQVFGADFHAGIKGGQLLQVLLEVLHGALAIVGVDPRHAYIVAPVLAEGSRGLVFGLLHPDFLEFPLVQPLGVVVDVLAHDVADLHHVGDTLDELLVGVFLFDCVFHSGLASLQIP